MAEVELRGEKFALSEDGISEIALLDFAEAASEGQDGDTLQGMASIKKLMRELIAPNDWGRFWAHARATRATVADDLMPVIKSAMEQMAERPTGRPSDSSDGPSNTPPKSVSTPAEPVTDRFSGRPDLQLMIAEERKAQAG